MVGQSERMVACRGSNHAANFFRIVEQEQGIAGAAFLKGACALQEIEFAKDLATSEIRKWDARWARRAIDAGGNPCVGSVHIAERNGCHREGSVTRCGW